MSEQILQQTADAILEKDIEIVIYQTKAKSKKGFVNWLLARKHDVVIPHRLVLKPLSVGTLIRISKMVVEITTDMFQDKAGLLDCSHQAAVKHGDCLIMTVAIALHNKKDPPAPEFVNMLRESLTTKELLYIFQAVVKQIDVTSFMTSIISIRGVNLLEMNPKSQRGQIASGGPSAAG